MKTKTYQGRWKTVEAEATYRRLAAAGWSKATASPPEARDVATSFGSTRTYRWPGEGPTVLCLHGATDTSVRWVPFAERLGDCDVYAVDTMGDVGESVHEVPFTGAADYPTWLAEVVDGLGLVSPHVVGQSMGGWLALSHAIAGHPVDSLILFDPVGVVKLQLGKFMRWGAATALGSYAPTRMRPGLARRLHAPLLPDRDEMRLALHAQRHHPIAIPPLPVFSDEELASIEAPVRALLGGRTSFFDTTRQHDRLAALASAVDVRILDDGGHQFTFTHFEESVALIRAAVDVDAEALDGGA